MREKVENITFTFETFMIISFIKNWRYRDVTCTKNPNYKCQAYTNRIYFLFY